MGLRYMKLFQAWRDWEATAAEYPSSFLR